MPSRPTIALLPLDDRPCNHQFPALLGPVAGVRVALPPKPLLGRFTRPGLPDACAAWLLESAQGADAAVVGLDMLAYGGIVAGRSADMPLRAALERLNALRRLRRAGPRMPILAVGLIRRLGTTVTSPESAGIHADLVRYSELNDRVARLGRTGLKAELRAVRRRLPRAALDEYVATRRRNHRVNRAAVALVADGMLDYLILAQEDALPAGPHVVEQRALRAQARALGVAARVAIHPGADEAGLVLLARAVCEMHGWRPRVAPIYSRPAGARTVALFEDRPIERTVRGQVAAVGALLAAAPRGEGGARGIGDADIELLVHTPRGRQTYPGSAPPHAPPASFLRRVVRAADAGRAAVADVAYCNGADPQLAAALIEAGVFADLAAYAGWNTAGNTVGAALAHAVLRQIGLAAARGQRERERRDLAHHTFLLHRLTDDCAYQSQVRLEAHSLAGRLGASPYRLGRHGAALAGFVRERLTDRCLEHFDQAFRGRALPGGRRLGAVQRIAVRLPWGRLFEVGLAIRLGAGGSP